MSVTATSQVVSYTGNNSTVTPYSYNVEFIDATTLVVYVKLTATGVLAATLTDGSGMTVTQLANKKGSFVTTAAWANTYTLVAAQIISPTQLSEYEENARFPASTVEGDFDKTTLLIQMLLAYQARSFGFPLYAPTVGLITPVANSVFTFDYLGAALLRSQTDFISWLNLVPGSFTGQGQKIFANAADRTAATPSYVGQLGVQIDTGAVYYGTALTVGSWTLYTTLPGAGTVTATMLTAALDLSLKTLTLPTGVIGPTNLSPNAIHTQTEKLSVATADEFLIWDSAASLLKRVTKANLGITATSLPFAFATYTPQIPRVAFSANIPLDNTAPATTEGTNIFAATGGSGNPSVTPTSTSQKVRISFSGIFGSGTTKTIIVAIFRGDTGTGTDVLVGVIAQKAGASDMQNISCTFVDSPATTSATTYKAMVGGSAGDLYVSAIAPGTPYFLQTAPPTMTLQVVS